MNSDADKYRTVAQHEPSREPGAALPLQPMPAFKQEQTGDVQEHPGRRLPVLSCIYSVDTSGCGVPPGIRDRTGIPPAKAAVVGERSESEIRQVAANVLPAPAWEGLNAQG